MAVPFTVVGIDHVVLRAADPTKLDRFYLDALGLTFESERELAQLRAGNALIDIVPADEAGPAGGTSSTGGANLDHLCFKIEGVPASFNWSPATGTLSSPARAGAKVGTTPRGNERCLGLARESTGANTTVRQQGSCGWSCRRWSGCWCRCRSACPSCPLGKTPGGENTSTATW